MSRSLGSGSTNLFGDYILKVIKFLDLREATLFVMVYWVTNGDQRSEPSFQDTRYTTELLLDFPQLMNINVSSST